MTEAEGIPTLLLLPPSVRETRLNGTRKSFRGAFLILSISIDTAAPAAVKGLDGLAGGNWSAGRSYAVDRAEAAALRNISMDSPSVSWLQQFDHSSRLLLCTLMSGHWGAMAAFRTLQRSQTAEKGKQNFSWQIFTEKLCSQELVLKGPNKNLTMKPLLMLLPVLCQRNLFSLLLILEPTVPNDCLNCLLQASRKDPNPDLWVQRLRDLLQQRMEERSFLTPLLLSNSCQQQLKEVCQKIMARGSSESNLKRKLNWFVKLEDPCLVPAEKMCMSESPVRKKKKITEEPLNFEDESQRKRSHSPPYSEVDTACTTNEFMLEISGNEDVYCLSSFNQFPPKENGKEEVISQHPQQDFVADLPDHIKKHIPKLNELLKMQANDTDGIAPTELQILNECTPSQLEGLCSVLKLSECLENELLQFCCWLVALSPELSYQNAAILAGKVFLPHVLLLTEPASWSLTTALTMFCSKYTRPVCCTLISSIVDDPGQGLEQFKLVCKLIEECLDLECVRLVFSHILKVSWTENLLMVVHSLLEKEVELSNDLFNTLVINLCQMAQEFDTSVHYAKLLLILLSKYQNNITLGHQHHISCALDLNKTILKKSLQAALKRLIAR